jgi:hypothetical protein
MTYSKEIQMKQVIALCLLFLMTGCAKTMIRLTWQDEVQQPSGEWVAFPDKLIMVQRPWGDSWALFEPSEKEDSCSLPRIMTSGGVLSEQGALVIMHGEELIEEGLETYLTMGANKGVKVIKDVVEENTGDDE